MKWIELPSPLLNDIEQSYKEFKYETEEPTYLPQPDPLPNKSLSEILSTRRSRRIFAPLDANRLNSLLWYSSKTQEVAPTNSCSRWQRRPCPSAGGRHPIDLVLINAELIKEGVTVYDPISHALSKVKLSDQAPIDLLITQINDLVPIGSGTIIWLGAQFQRTLSKYKGGESLVWRDAGVIISTIYLVAEVLDLNCCALGISGEPLFSTIVGSNGDVIGVGGLIIGAKP